MLSEIFTLKFCLYQTRSSRPAPQRALELLCSYVRSKNPGVVEFKLSQISEPSYKGCDYIGERVDLMQFLAEQSSQYHPHADLSHSVHVSDISAEMEQPDMLPLGEVEKRSLVFLASYISPSVILKFKLCETYATLLSKPLV